MKIILFANSFYPLALIDSLLKQNMIAGVIAARELNPYNVRLEESVTSMGIPFIRFSSAELSSDAPAWIKNKEPDVLLVFTFGYKIPRVLLDIPPLGTYNVHFSLLPKYRGIAPLFWQIKNGDLNGGLTIHKMDVGFDTGPVVSQLPVAIYPGESQGIFAARLSHAAVEAVLSALELIRTQEPSSYLKVQDENELTYYKAPDIGDLAINWLSQTAQQIINLVSAANPACQGAIAMFRGQVIRVLEVSLTMLGEGIPQQTPGTIVHADVVQGLFVQCINGEFLRVNVVEMPEGIFSGFTMAALGARAGEVLETFHSKAVPI
jgi:methionyl-tRNA formyltransferase